MVKHVWTCVSSDWGPQLQHLCLVVWKAGKRLCSAKSRATSKWIFLTLNLWQGLISLPFSTKLDALYNSCRRLQSNPFHTVLGEGLNSTQRPPVLSCSTSGSAGSLLPHWPAVWEQLYWLSSLLSCSWDRAGHSQIQSQSQQRPFCGLDSGTRKSWTWKVNMLGWDSTAPKQGF